MRARETWSGSALPAVTIPSVVSPAMAADARARFERAGYTRFGRLDRGRYDGLDHPQVPEILEALTGIAKEITGRDLTLAEARVVRLVPGDYILVRHDRVYEGRPVELTLDLSPEDVAGAEVHFRHRGQVFFVFASTPGALAIVERGPTVMCNHTYLTKRRPNTSVVRLVVRLATVA